MPDGGAARPMTRSAFAGTLEGEARLLLLIDAFSAGDGTLQGRTKLAKLDFLLRYPRFFNRAMVLRKVRTDVPTDVADENNIEQRMVRYRYGPWDPAYYALLGALLGRGLITTIPTGNYLGFRTTARGREVAARLAATEAWQPVAARADLLRRAFRTQQGTFLKNWIYEHFPEVTQASWGESL
jgi:hypothetical protein